MRNLSCDVWKLVPWPRIELRPPALRSWSLSHCTTREVPPMTSSFFIQIKARSVLHQVQQPSPKVLSGYMWGVTTLPLGQRQQGVGESAPCLPPLLVGQVWGLFTSGSQRTEPARPHRSPRSCQVQQHLASAFLPSVPTHASHSLDSLKSLSQDVP